MDDIEIHVDPQIEVHLRRLSAVEEATMEVAKKIAERARDTAPVASGAYKASIKVEDFRGGARVIATDPKSAWIEFGAPARGVAARFVLRNAAASLGFKFKKGKGD